MDGQNPRRWVGRLWTAVETLQNQLPASKIPIPGSCSTFPLSGDENILSSVFCYCETSAGGAGTAVPDALADFINPVGHLAREKRRRASCVICGSLFSFYSPCSLMTYCDTAASYFLCASQRLSRWMSC